MSNRLKKLLKDDLIAHTAIVFFGTTLAGAFNLLYHLAAVRLLMPEDYGTFNALISFVMFTAMAISPLRMTLTRFFTEYIAKREFAKLILFFKRLVKRLFIIAGVAAALFFVISPFLAVFFKTQLLYIFICGGVIIASLFSPAPMSIFQSFQKFTIYSLIGVIASLGKLVLGVFLMFFGFKVLGGLFGYLAGAVLLPVIGLIFIFSIFKEKIGSVDVKALPAVSLVPICKYFFRLLSLCFLLLFSPILMLSWLNISFLPLMPAIILSLKLWVKLPFSCPRL